MNKFWILFLVFGFALLPLIARGQQNQTGENVDVRSGISHDEYERLLKKYVNDQGLVNYAAGKGNQGDLSALVNYLKQFADKIGNPAQGNERAVSLVNVYNALVLRWILSSYPTESIWQSKDSFSGKRHEIGGRKVSLNDIENGTLRPLLGYRAHAVLVCAARSCPPLQRFAYTAPQLDEQIDTAYRSWLAREDLNRFVPEQVKVEISSIFNWFKDDFDRVGGAKNILVKYAPQKYQVFLAGGDYQISYLPYNWGLNDQSDHGKNYNQNQMIWDSIINAIQFWK